MELEQGDGDSESITKLKRSTSNTAIRNGIIFELVLAVVWGLVGRVLQSGWIMAVVNVVFLLISLLMANVMASFLRNRFSGLVSIIVSAVIWVIIFGLFRGLF